MKILQISNRVPWPLNEGGNIGIYNYTRAFSELGHDVSLYCLDAIKHNTPLGKAKIELEKYAKVHIIPINTDLRVEDAFQSLLRNESYNVNRFYNGVFNSDIREVLKNEKFDVVQLEGTFTGPYLSTVQANFDGLISLRMHNVEFEIWERLAKNEKNPIKKVYLKILAKQLKSYESRLIKQVDSIVPVTDTDGEIFSGFNPKATIFTSSTGIDLDRWEYSEITGFQNWYHLGSMEWHANQEAVSWFIDEIHPLLANYDTSYRLHIGGKGLEKFESSLKTKQSQLYSDVPDAYSFVKDMDVCVVPLKSGSGIRIKILEAMAAGKLVISTSIGAQGINCTDGENILIADSPEAFLNIYKKLKTNEINGLKIARNGYNLIKENYSQMARAKQLIDFYKSRL